MPYSYSANADCAYSYSANADCAVEEVVVAAVVVGEVAGEVALDGVDSAQGGCRTEPVCSPQCLP